MELKSVDIVKLKSGGPNMTIIGFQSGSVRCSWFDSSNKLESALFSIASLTVINIDDKPGIKIQN